MVLLDAQTFIWRLTIFIVILYILAIYSLLPTSTPHLPRSASISSRLLIPTPLLPRAPFLPVPSPKPGMAAPPCKICSAALSVFIGFRDPSIVAEASRIPQAVKIRWRAGGTASPNPGEARKRSGARKVKKEKIRKTIFKPDDAPLIPTSRSSTHDHRRRSPLCLQVLPGAPECTFFESVDKVHTEDGYGTKGG